MKKTIVLVIIPIILGAISGTLTSFAILNLENSEGSLIKKFYLTENAVYVSPHSLRLKMDKGINDYILVDLRSQEEYESEHIVGAISIPAYKDKETPAYNETDRIVNAFSKLPKDKEIIVYCYSIPCMSGRKIGKLLAENEIYVKQLGIGWNEWRYFWNLWNHEYEWDIINISDYVVSGKDPGIPQIRNYTSSCAISGGC